MKTSYSSPHIGRVAAAAVAAAVLAGAITPPAAAQTFFEARRDFRLEKACDATRTIRTKTEPSPLEAGSVVEARGVNRADNPTHAFVVIGDQSKWLDLACGIFMDDQPAADPGVVDDRPGRQPACLPFFDEVDNPVPVGFGGTADITPKKPELNAFDKAINAVCGAPGKVVAQDEFKLMLRAHPAVLERIRTFTAGKVFADRPQRSDNETYLSDLAEAWFAVKAFDHIFCGEPNPASGGGRIGGLHFHGRYVQLQEQGHACRMNNLRQNEVVPGVVYTMGVVMKNASGRFVKDARKGYGLTLSGEDILKAATRGFAENPTSSGESQGCLLPLTDDARQFTTVFVRRKAGIRTFYPDATPGRGGKPTPPCSAALKL